MRQRKPTVLPLLFLLAPICLIGCSGESFSGTFAGSYMGQAAQATLAEGGGKVTGTVQWSGMQSTVDATVDGKKLSGTVRNRMAGVTLPFTATLKDEDSLEWVYDIENPFTGRSQRVVITLTRQAAASGGAAVARLERDPRLVGHWRRTVTPDTGLVGPGRTIVSTDIYCSLFADGRFEYGGAVTGVSSPDWGRAVGPGNIVRGIWKSEGQNLFSKPDGAQQWVLMGRYALSGAALVLYSGGQKQLWERQ